MRSEILKTMHRYHLGIVKTKNLARDMIFWPDMDGQIEDLVSRCATCQSQRKALPKQPLISHDIPQLPWMKLGCDLFKFKGRDYVLCVDYYSKYPDVVLLPNTSTTAVVSALKAMFARFGVPKELM